MVCFASKISTEAIQAASCTSSRMPASYLSGWSLRAVATRSFCHGLYFACGFSPRTLTGFMLARHDLDGYTTLEEGGWERGALPDCHVARQTARCRRTSRHPDLDTKTGIERGREREEESTHSQSLCYSHLEVPCVSPFPFPFSCPFLLALSSRFSALPLPPSLPLSLSLSAN